MNYLTVYRRAIPKLKKDVHHFPQVVIDLATVLSTESVGNLHLKENG